MRDNTVLERTHALSLTVQRCRHRDVLLEKRVRALGSVPSNDCAIAEISGVPLIRRVPVPRSARQHHLMDLCWQRLARAVQRESNPSGRSSPAAALPSPHLPTTLSNKSALGRVAKTDHQRW